MTVRLGGVLKLLDPVFELNPLNDFGQAICSAEFSPFLFRRHHKFEDHGHSRFAAHAALRFACSVAYGGEDAFDRVGGSDVLPVLGREVVERQQHVAIFDQLLDRPLVFHAVGCHAPVTSGIRAKYSERPPKTW